MRFVIQRVMHSKVTINGEVRGQIGKGFMVLIGVGEEDTVEIADKMIHKMVNMRILEDENGKTNLALIDCYIYELNAAQLRYQFLLQSLKKRELQEV